MSVFINDNKFVLQVVEMDSMEEIVSLTVAGTVSMMKFVTNKMEHVDPVPRVIVERNAKRV